MRRPQLPAFALPFVTRAMRGPRKRRYLMLSALLAALTVLLGAYMALGEGRFEQEVRVELGHEVPHWQQQRREFKVLTREDWEHGLHAEAASRARALRDRDRSSFLKWADLGWDEPDNPMGHSEVASQIYSGYDELLSAIRTPAQRAHQRALQRRAADFLGLQVAPAGALWDEDYVEFAWYDEVEVERLEAILDRQLVPAVEAYASPLGIAGAIRFVGGLATLFLSLLALVFAPLFVAVRQASEMHENTLQPLTGTALSPRELARGLRWGPLAVVAIFAAPLAGIAALSALAVGTPFRILVGFVVLASGAYGLSALAQLVGHLAGQRRTPGIVGVSLMMLMGMAWLIGSAIGFDAPRDAMSMIGALPQSSAAYVQVWALGVAEPTSPDMATLTTIAFGAFAWAFFGALTTRVLAHRIGGLEGPALNRRWAFGGASVAIMLACLSSTVLLRGHVSIEDRQIFYFLGLLVLAVPFGLLLMSRVPLAEAPPSMRTLPLPRLVGELLGMVALHMAVAAAFVGPHALDVLGSPVAVAYLLWSVSIVGLVAIRAASLPVSGMLAHAWFAFCALCVLVAGAHVVGWTTAHGLNGADDILALGNISPLLGLLQAVALVVVPWVCVRSLSTRFRGLR